jgi:hypothetical protein
MNRTANRIAASLALVGVLWLGGTAESLVFARGGGGGGRGGGGGGRVGGGGGGGARPSMGHMSAPAARPSPSASRPNVSRPSAPPASRPSFSNAASRPAARPAPAQRPSMGPSAQPGAGMASRPASVARPTPGAGTRPGAPGGSVATRPSVPGTGAARPGIAAKPPSAATRPAADRPSLGNISGGTANRPGLGNLAGGDRPGPGGERPGIPGIRPAPSPGRPGTGGERPGIGGDRPGTGGVRPGTGDRPVIGGGGNNIVNRPGGGNRPIIGGGNTNIGGGNTINRPGGNNNFVNINNRPGWGGGYWGGGHWGGGYGNWAGNWHDHHINPHYNGWYHGCWGGHWGNHWYVPLAYGAAAWGVNALLPAWGYGYGYSYSNPYYVASSDVAQPVYDYSQPIVINTYDTPAEEATAGSEQPPAQPAVQDSPEQVAGYGLFDQAHAAFLQGDYRSALALDEQAIQKSPRDPVLHEFGAVCLFALGDYNRAAAVLNAFLAVAPGMDWTTMISLYPNVDAYTQQLRALEAHCKQKPDDTAAQFVLAYQYLVAGHDDAAAVVLKRVVAKQPGDLVAQQMLEALSPQPAEQAVAAQAPAPAAADAQPAEAPATDLVGRWRAERGGDVFDLTIDENGQFTWKAVPKGKAPVTIGGKVVATSDVLVLDSKDQGSMVGRVTSGGPDQFQFVSTGGPPNDKGLEFKRTKESG